MAGKRTRIICGSLIVAISLTLVLKTALAQRAEDVYEAHKRLTDAQASEDPLIGIWSGSMCGKRIVLAVIRNDEQNGYRLKAVLLNGKEVGYGFKNADSWFYVSAVAVAGVYEGKTLYRNRFFKNWYPNRVVMTGDDTFTAVDDAKNSCGPPTNVYVRREPRAKTETMPVTKLGSGFLLRQTRFVMTAYHVIEGANEIHVRFPSGDKYTAELVARDAVNDLAILRLVDFKPSDDGFRYHRVSLSTR
jgi:S1-C subfamily serine protease